MVLLVIEVLFSSQNETQESLFTSALYSSICSYTPSSSNQ